MLESFDIHVGDGVKRFSVCRLQGPTRAAQVILAACMWADMCNGGVEQQDSSEGRTQIVGFLGAGTLPELT